MLDHLPLFEIHLRRRRRKCRWHLSTTDGRVLMQGAEFSRAAARYQAHRALFLMLFASAHESTAPGRPAKSPARRSRTGAD